MAKEISLETVEKYTKALRGFLELINKRNGNISADEFQTENQLNKRFMSSCFNTWVHRQIWRLTGCEVLR